MRYGYIRISSKQQLDGYGLDVQEEQVRNAGAEVVYTDVFTGTSVDRPELQKLLKVLKSGDELVVARLDRLARTALIGCELIKELVEKNVRVTVLNMGTLDNTPCGKMMVTVMFAMAEFERDTIMERFNYGKQQAKAKNPKWREGRKRNKYSDEFLATIFDQQERGVITIKEAMGFMHINDYHTYHNHKKWFLERVTEAA